MTQIINKRNSKYFLLSLLILAVLHKLSILQPVETGQDAVRKWLMMKSLWWTDISNIFWEWSHHSTRWGINIPTLPLTYLFNESVNMYYVVPLTAYLVTIFYIFRLSKLYFNDLRVLIAPLTYIFFAQYSRYAVQLIPAVFSNVYMIMSFYYLATYLEFGAKKRNFFLSIFLIFCGYLSKVDNVFFLAPFLLYIWMAKKDLKLVFQYAILLFGLYLSETAIYAIFTEYNFGRLQIILGTHVDAEYRLVPHSFLDLFERMTVVGSPLIYFFAFFFGYAPFYLWKIKKQSLTSKALFFTVFIYYFLKMFVLKSYNPLVPLEVTKERYMLSPVPFLILFAVYHFHPKLVALLNKVTKKQAGAFVGVLLAIMIARNVKQVAAGEHRLQANRKLKALLNEAYDKNIPIMTDHYKNYYNVHRYYMTKEHQTENGAYVETTTRVKKYDAPGANKENAYYSYRKDHGDDTLEDIFNGCHLMIKDKFYKFKTVNCPEEMTYSYK